jgi:glucose-6-phosphate 1-dehydrogenase
MPQPAPSDKSTTIVIFGASGDLTQRKLLPALFNLFTKKRLPSNFHIVGVARTSMDDDTFRSQMHDAVIKFCETLYTKDQWAGFAPRLSYHTCDIAAPGEEQKLAAALATLEGGPADRLFYLATPPNFFGPIVAAIGRAHMEDETEGFRRLVVEKPFGTDLKSAQTLSAELHNVLNEDQIYRIDHYLGKESVQNMLVFRFANGIFEPIWNRNYIDHVQISALETVDVGHRAGYYDGVGVLRDMFQNHMLALLTFVAMEPPSSFKANPLRNERAKVLSEIRPITPDRLRFDTVRGQYSTYKQAEGIAPDSQTPTYAALRLFIDNWRWQDVPFYLRSGKALKDKRTEIIIRFKRPPHMMFPEDERSSMTANILSLCLQPDEGIHLRFEAKMPDTVATVRSVDMDFNYAETFGPGAVPEAYERLLLDTLHGDQSLFNRSDQVELAWQLLDPILAGWNSPDAPPLGMYDAGTFGPKGGAFLIEGRDRTWLRGCGDGVETTGEVENP